MDLAADWKKRFRKKFRAQTFPPRIIANLEKFQPPSNIKNFIIKMKKIKGSGIYIHGNVGSGKTVLAAMILEMLRLDEYVNPSSTTEEYTSWAQFIAVCDLLMELRSTFKDQNKYDETDIIKKYSNSKYLILDDIGVEKFSNWSFQSLYLIINHRYNNLRPIIFTSNLDLETLARQLGDDRIPSRIYEMCYVYKMNNFDMRLKVKK